MDMGKGYASFHGGHSKFGDGEGEVIDVARSAADKGFVAFGFSEHFSLPPAAEYKRGAHSPLNTRPEGWLDRYVDAVQAAKRELSDRISILMGTELEYITGAGDWTLEQTSKWPFDYFVGSVHFVRYDGQDNIIDADQRRFDEALRRAGSPEQLQLDYYDHVLGLLEWKIAHVLGHIDIIKMLMTTQQRGATPKIRTKVLGVLETMRDRGVAMDINARGLTKPCKEIYPVQWILEEAQRVGVKVTLGDDSHHASQVGMNLDQSVDALRRAGYEKMSLVRSGGVLEEVPLP